MGDNYTSISVTKDTLARINDAMPESYDSKDAYLSDLVENGEVTVSGEGLSGAQYDELVERLERIEASASTAESRTGTIEGTLEDLSR